RNYGRSTHRGRLCSRLGRAAFRTEFGSFGQWSSTTYTKCSHRFASVARRNVTEVGGARQGHREGPSTVSVSVSRSGEASGLLYRLMQSIQPAEAPSQTRN